MPDKVILDHKKSCFVSFEIFYFFFNFQQKLAQVKKITKIKIFKNDQI
jgi:hypothetical protein